VKEYASQMGLYQTDSAVLITVMLVALMTDIEQLYAFIFCTFEKILALSEMKP